MLRVGLRWGWLTCLLITTGCHPAAVVHRTVPAERQSVWLDVDTSAGLPGRDIDDAISLIQAFHSSKILIRGVSVVFGNTDVEAATAITRMVVERFGDPSVPIYLGASSAAQRGESTPATRALNEALHHQRLTLLALGPVTNIASVLEQQPELVSQIEGVVAVAGRRPGQRFIMGERDARAHRDFNFEKDPESFRLLLASPLSITLAPWELSSSVWIRAQDVERWRHGSAATRWLATVAPSWLTLWQERFGTDGFNPFDALAVAVVTDRDSLHCQSMEAHIEHLPDDVFPPGSEEATHAQMKPYLLVGSEHSVNPQLSQRTLMYCDRAAPDFAARLTNALLGR